MALVDAIYQAFAKPLLQWSHVDDDLLVPITADGSVGDPLPAIQMDERWETEYVPERGERRVRVCSWSIPAEQFAEPQLRGKLKVVATGEIWRPRTVVSRDQHWVHIECVLVAAHEIQRDRLRESG